MIGPQIVPTPNTTGAAGIIGVNRVVHAAPDGYTFLFGSIGTHAYNQSLYKTPLYNAVSDFTPVGLATESTRMLIARKDLPCQVVKQHFLEYRSEQKFDAIVNFSLKNRSAVLFITAILGAGEMGETLLSGLVRAGRPPAA